MKIRFLLAASVIAMSAVTDVAAFAQRVTGASSTSDGQTVTSLRNPDGSHTVTNGPIAPPVGKYDATVTGPDGVTRAYVPTPRPTTTGASSTSNGHTTTSVRNPDRSHTVTNGPIAPPAGKYDATVTGPDGVTRAYVPAPRPTTTGASSTSNGHTTTSVRNPDGSHTVTAQPAPAPVSGFASWFTRSPNAAMNVQASPE